MPENPAEDVTGTIVFLDEPELTYDDFYRLYGPGPPVDDEGNWITAAAQVDSTTNAVHTGAMIALIPAVEDLQRLVLSGGEASDQLHLTLVYLGDAVDIDDESRIDLLANVQTIIDDFAGPVVGHVFGLAVFNPLGEEPCVVMLVGSPGEVPELTGVITPLDEAHDAAIWAAEEAGVDTAMSKRPWVPHITLAYFVDEMSTEVLDSLNVNDLAGQRVGSVTFDRLRVAFGGEIHDFNIAPIVASAFHNPGKHNQKDHGRGGGGGKDTPGADKSDGGDGGGGGGGGAPATGAAAHEACPVKSDDPDLSTGERAALTSYQGEGYVAINDGLRNPPPTPVVKAEIDALDSAMSRSVLAEDIQVERGVLVGSHSFGDAWSGDMTGGTFTERGFMSTTSSSQVAGEQFSNPMSRSSARIVMTVPAGTSAIDMGHSVSEAEILLDRGTSWRITSDTGPGRGRVIEMELIPSG